MNNSTDNYQLKKELRSAYDANHAPDHLTDRVLTSIYAEQLDSDISYRWNWTHNVGFVLIVFTVILTFILYEQDKYQDTVPMTTISMDIPSLSQLPNSKVDIAVPGLASMARLPELPVLPSLSIQPMDGDKENSSG